MYLTTSVTIVLGIFATATLEATGSHVRRKYSKEDLFLTPSYTKPVYFASAPGNPLSRYPSRRLSIRPSTSLRVKPVGNSGPKFTSPLVVRPMNLAGVGQHGHRNTKPKMPDFVQSGRLRPTPLVGTKLISPKNAVQSELRPNDISEHVKMKPVYEEGMLPKVPIYINAFPESSQNKVQKSKDVTRTMNYEPLGNYAKF